MTSMTQHCPILNEICKGDFCSFWSESDNNCAIRLMAINLSKLNCNCE